MIKTTGFEKGVLSRLLFGHLVGYRVVPAMYILATSDKNGKSYAKALAGFEASLRAIWPNILNDIDIPEMIEAHKDWICYTFHDMLYYYHKIEMFGLGVEAADEERMKYYLPAMAEIVNSPLIEWRHGIFSTGIEHSVILDVGCGLFPFLKLFRRDNTGNIYYLGVDKRDIDIEPVRSAAPERVMPKLYRMGIEEYLKSRLPYIMRWKERIDTVFFGNSFHCLPDAKKILQRIARLPNVTKIMILEFAPQSTLNFMFDFHMYMHAGDNLSVGTHPTPPKGWTCYDSYPTTQHIMYTYTKAK